MAHYKDKKYYYVYVHINKTNGKMYFGKCLGNPQYRWGKDGHGYCKSNVNTLFSEKIKEYGWNGFDHIVLFCGLTNKEACDLEKFYIKEYKTNVCRWNKNANGYNMTDGGEDGKRSVDCPGKAIRIINLNTNEIFETIKKAGQSIGQKGCNITASIKRKCKCGGYYWDYADDPINKDLTSLLAEIEQRQKDGAKKVGDKIKGRIKTEEECKHLSEALKHSKRNKEEWLETQMKATSAAAIKNKKKVLRIEDGKIYDSATEAATEINGDPSSITKCCKGKVKTHKGYHYEYVKDDALC